MKTSFIIATYNREEDLKKCLISLINQSYLPDEIIVIDDGDLSQIPMKDIIIQKGIKYIYQKKDDKGLTKSRNLGVSLSSGDIIFFIDDDVILDSDYLLNMLKLYSKLLEKDPHIGGMGGIEINLKKPTFFTYLDFFYNLIFLISPYKPHRFTKSGFSDTIPTNRIYKLYDLKNIMKVEFLGGSNFSFLRKVFEDFSFSEDYSNNYCLGEDKDFTIRVSQKYNLYLNPDAKIIHNKSEKSRMDLYKRGYNFILSNYRHFSLYLQKNKTDKLLFLYSSFGYLIKRLILAMLTNNKEEFNRVKGILFGILLIIKQ